MTGRGSTGLGHCKGRHTNILRLRAALGLREKILHLLLPGHQLRLCTGQVQAGLDQHLQRMLPLIGLGLKRVERGQLRSNAWPIMGRCSWQQAVPQRGSGSIASAHIGIKRPHGHSTRLIPS